MRFLVFMLLCVLSVTNLHSQFSGRVLSSDNKMPVALANVYINNSMIGTVSNDQGLFSIDRIPELKFELIISCIGYETQKLSLEKNKIPSSLIILLKPKINELQEVIVEPYEKDGWEKWGPTFRTNFIGTSAFSADCIFKNKEVLRFRFNRKKNQLTVTADDRLVFENNALGYLLKYDLTKFTFDFRTNEFSFEGYPFFEPMESDKKRIQNRWKDNRREAYYGSLTHFMRSVYRNKLLEEGFEVRTLINVSNQERERVRKIDRETAVINKTKENTVVNLDSLAVHYPPDSIEYFKKVMDLKGAAPVILQTILKGDSIAFASDSITCFLDFATHLSITYKHKKNPSEYYRYLPRGQEYRSVISEIYRTSNEPIRVMANGSFFDGRNLMTLGFWSWWEKICNRLPNDYKPDKPVK